MSRWRKAREDPWAADAEALRSAPLPPPTEQPVAANGWIVPPEPAVPAAPPVGEALVAPLAPPPPAPPLGLAPPPVTPPASASPAPAPPAPAAPAPAVSSSGGRFSRRAKVEAVVAAEAGPDREVPAPRPVLTLPWPPLVVAESGFSLRPWGGAPSDAAALVAAWADPDIAHFTKVPDRADHDAAVRWIAGEERRRESGYALDLVIAVLDGPEQVLGEVGLVVVEPGRLWAELGFWLAPDARGHGLATAAVAAFSRWVLRDLPVRRLFAQIHPANPRSASVVQRAGYTSAGHLDGGTEVWVLDA